MLFNRIMDGDITSENLIERDKELRRMLHFHKLSSTMPFKKAYRSGFKNYLKGDW